MAHPDVFMRGYKTFDSHCEEVAYRLCEKAKEYQLPLEYNWQAIRTVAIRILNFGRSPRKSAALVLLGSMPTRGRL